MEGRTPLPPSTRKRIIDSPQIAISICQNSIYTRQKSIYVHKMRAASVKSSLTFIKYTLHAK
jgi:hypothetical protein